MDNKLTKFSEWLLHELEDRGWSIREVARRAELSHATINGILSEKANPGLDFCLGIARAFRMPPEIILRKAGLLPQLTKSTEENQQLVEYFQYLDNADRDRLLVIARTLYEHRAEYSRGDQ